MIPRRPAFGVTWHIERRESNARKIRGADRVTYSTLAYDVRVSRFFVLWLMVWRHEAAIDA